MAYVQNFTFLVIIYFLFVAHFHLYITNFRYVTVFRTVDIVKDCSWAMLSLNTLMYSQIIKIFCSCSEYAKILYFTN